jgi:4-carboxymuconolactone decarboxylase
MSRLPLAGRDTLDPEGIAVWDHVVSTRGARVVDAEHHLTGPFNAFVSAPAVGGRLSELGAALHQRTSIDRRLREVAIITVGAHWKAEFEWWAHARVAREVGVPDDVVDAIGNGTTPRFARDDERVIYAVASQLAEHGRIDAESYEAAHELLGGPRMVELVSLCGYYTAVAFLLNAFEVPLPPDAPVQWST